MAGRAGEVSGSKEAGNEEMSPAEHLPQVYDDLLKLAAAGMRHEAAGQPRTDVRFAGESNSPQPASVGHTDVSS